MARRTGPLRRVERLLEEVARREAEQPDPGRVAELLDPAVLDRLAEAGDAAEMVRRYTEAVRCTQAGGGRRPR